MKFTYESKIAADLTTAAYEASKTIHVQAELIKKLRKEVDDLKFALEGKAK